VIVDLHAHTSLRSNCSQASLEQLVADARAAGLDALCVTEHDVRWSDEELADASRALGFPLIGGVELTTDVGHVLVFGPLRRPLWAGYTFARLVEEVERTGTALVLPHPLRRHAGERAIKGGRTPPEPAEVAAWPQWQAVHAIEVASTQTSPLEQRLVAETLRLAPRPTVGASDAHAPGRVGTYATVVEATVRDAAGLAEAIRAGHVRATPAGS
jgi:predicted metal-dependent phosphoesterase TrpH